MKRGFAFVLLLTGCVAETTQTQSGEKTDKALAAVDAFGSVCLVPDLTVNRAAEAAKAANVGLIAPTQYKVPGNPTVELAARSNEEAISDPNKSFDWFNCMVVFRGTWADQVSASVKSRLTLAGFRIVSGFQRQTVPVEESWTVVPVQSSDGQEAIQYKGIVSRGGRTFVALVAQSPAGTGNHKGTNIEFEASTRLILSTN